MAFLDTARGLLSHHRVLELAAAHRALGERRAALAAELARAEHTVPWWDRALFFHDTPDEARAKELRGQLEALDAEVEEARAQRDAALAACTGGCPPLGVVFRLEGVLDAALASRRHARAIPEPDAMAGALEAIATDVLARWAPGTELGALVGGLTDGEARAAAAARTLDAPRRDDALAWAPMPADELFARVAREIEAAGAYRAALARVGSARVRREAVVAALAEAEERIGLWDRIVPGVGSAEQRRDAHEQQLGEEDRRLVAAIEEAHHAVVHALARHPVAWVALASLGAAAALRAVEPRREAALDPRTGALLVVPSAYSRAVVVACLLEARAACVAAFEGLPDVVAPRARRDEGTAHPGAERGPYRMQGAIAREEPRPEKGATEESRQFFARLDGSGLRDELRGAVSHASMLGLLRRCGETVRARIGWLDRAAFWSSSTDEAAEDALAERAAFHALVLQHRAVSALGIVEGAAAQHPLLDLGRCLATAHLTTPAISTLGGSSGTSRHCPVFRREEVVAALDRAVAGLCARYGTTADRGALVNAVCDHLRRAGGHPLRPPEGTLESPADVALLLAARLQGTAFLETVETLAWAQPAASDARHQASAAASAVSLWDKLNVFTDSPDEQRRDALRDEAAVTDQLVRDRHAAFLALYRDALRWHPPSLLADEALDVRAAFEAIRAVSERRTRTTKVGNTTTTTTYYVCVLHGRTVARSMLATWAGRMIAVLGPIPCAGDLLDEWVAGELA